jgi:hypothetical protein
VRNFFLMSLICALVFVAFMALPGTIVPMHAEPGMQGNLPTPVQKLPTHPPIACVAPNWENESCDSRQTPLPRPNPLGALALKPPRPKTVLYDEPGGGVQWYIERWRAVDASGNDVEIRGSCASACTLVMAVVPADRICFGDAASLRFHMSSRFDVPTAETAQWMLDQYPQDIRLWIMAKGGVEKMTIEQMWTLAAPELWAMGYRKCGPEEKPPEGTLAPMTKVRSTFMGELAAETRWQMHWQNINNLLVEMFKFFGMLADAGERVRQACSAFSGDARRACIIEDMRAWPDEWHEVRDNVTKTIQRGPGAWRNGWPLPPRCPTKDQAESDAWCTQ